MEGNNQKNESNINGDSNNTNTNSNNTNKELKSVYWNEDDDKILKEWVDKSACFKWLHEQSYKIYKKSYLRQMIPVIVISTLTGAANFALDRITNEQSRSYASIAVGSFNIIAAMISTVSQFLKTSEYKEGHNIAAKSWDKFNRSLKLELQRNPSERSNKRELFNISIKEYDRLVEISPDIPTSVIIEFRNLYKDNTNLIKPESTGHIISSRIYEVKEKDHAVIVFENTQNEDDEETKLRNKYIDVFKTKYERIPTQDEINEYLELKNISIA
jgi:hypothetical protein